MKTQKEQIKVYLENGGKLTPMSALNFWGCFRLSGRILELRRAGMDIETKMVKTATGKYVAEYSQIEKTL